MSSAVSVPGSAGRARTVVAIVALAVTGKALAFVREAFIASQLGASATADAYYIALAIPTVVYSLGALPFAMWVTARLAALKGSGAAGQLASFYSRSLLQVTGAGVVLALVIVGPADVLVGLYAPGLDAARVAAAATPTRIAAFAIPALGIQAICNGRLFADGRFLPVYVWLVLSGLVGLGVVVAFTPHHGASAAALGFVAAAWTSILGPVVLARRITSSQSDGRSVGWVEDLGASIVVRALVMQLYFQGSLILVYGFGSTLPPGELSASLFGSKVQNAVYETLAVTAGVLVYPRIARFLQTLDQGAVKRTMLQALSWLLPATAALVVLLVVCRREIVSILYERNAFDDRAARLVSAALLGYAPGILGLTLVEIFHRTMVLRGRLGGYVVVFAGALFLNWLSCRLLISQHGVLGLTLSSSVGVLAAGAGLVVYASRRLESMDTRRVLFLVVRTALAAGLTMAIIGFLHGALIPRQSVVSAIVTVVGSGVGVTAVLSLALFLLGHRWHIEAPVHAPASVE